MSQQQQIQKQEQQLSISQILRVYGKQFKQITEQFSDGHNGRCAVGRIEWLENNYRMYFFFRFFCYMYDFTSYSI